MAERVVPPGVEERVKRIEEVCDTELKVLLDNIEFALFQSQAMRGRIEPYTRDALKKSFLVLLDCVDTVEAEFR